MSASTFEIAGRDGWQIMTSPNFTPVEIVKANFDRYRASLVDHGHDPAAFSYPIMQQVYVAETEEAAYEEPRESCMSFFHKLSSLLPTEVKGDGNGTKSGGDNYEQFRRTQRKMADLRYDYLYEGSVLFGTPGRLIDRLRSLKEETGLSYLIGWYNFANLPQDMVKKSMRLFAEEVMPALVDQREAAEPSLV